MSFQLIINIIFHGETFATFPLNSGIRKSDPSPLLNIILEAEEKADGKMGRSKEDEY